MKFVNIEELTKFRTIGIRGFKVLCINIEEIFNCHIEIDTKPIDDFESNFGCSFSFGEKRGVIDTEEGFLLICKVYVREKGLTYVVSLSLKGELIKFLDRSVIHKLSNTITATLTESYNMRFENLLMLVDDYFVYRLINNVLIKGAYNLSNIHYFLNAITNINNSTFENEYFRTGFILSNSFHEYLEDEGREGKLMKLSNPLSLLKSDRYNSRLWFMVDGYKDFYVVNKYGNIYWIYIRKDSTEKLSNFIEQYTLSSVLSGQDLLLRTLSHSQLSVLNSKGYEFIRIQNKWKFRDYSKLKEILSNLCGDIQKEVVDVLIYYILYCSRNNISSIIWIPEDTTSVSEFLIHNNDFVEEDINIIDAMNEAVVKRMLESDGATVISKTGNILGYGSIIKLDSTNSSSVSGTGESASKLLSSNGVSIKNSQDGFIKIYYNISKKIIY